MANRRGSPQIKICGITQAWEAFYLNEVHAEYAGFVFWQKSKRNVSFTQAEEIHKFLAKSIKRVAVTVSPDLQLVRRAEQAGFDILQVHGELQGGSTETVQYTNLARLQSARAARYERAGTRPQNNRLCA